MEDLACVTSSRSVCKLQDIILIGYDNEARKRHLFVHAQL